MGKWFHPTLYWACDYLSIIGLKLINVSKRGPWGLFYLDSLCKSTSRLGHGQAITPTFRQLFTHAMIETKVSIWKRKLICNYIPSSIMDVIAYPNFKLSWILVSRMGSMACYLWIDVALTPVHGDVLASIIHRYIWTMKSHRACNSVIYFFIGHSMPCIINVIWMFYIKDLYWESVEDVYRNRRIIIVFCYVFMTINAEAFIYTVWRIETFTWKAVNCIFFGFIQ